MGGVGAPLKLGIRPEKLRLAAPEAAIVAGTVAAVEYMGENAHIHVATPASETLVLKVDRLGSLAPGQPVHLGFDPADARIFAAETGLRLAA
ncbi:hypothetical protein GCM10011390_23670 [Aureimonas endophytica]|uniref:Transport-associated OB type 2 domain-containing protein n=1 Tax=Aureimonas endophytica TaxID=2027858 RepID=A0A917E4X7_9HYPH|nr:TOBE domain-containing protein [Aureimonas endophytica]GGE04002.1 hypothetical protein GCM10011390_23670 [Aureimonas endophytica]